MGPHIDTLRPHPRTRTRGAPNAPYPRGPAAYPTTGLPYNAPPDPWRRTPAAARAGPIAPTL